MARRGLSLHLRPARPNGRHHESFLDAFARDPFFRPLFNEVAATARQVGRPPASRPHHHHHQHPQRPLQANVNVLETPQGFAIEAELPGIRREDIKVEVCEGDRLVIRGEKRLDQVNTTNINNNNNTTSTKVGSELKESKEVSAEAEADQHEQKQHEQGRYLTCERSYGVFERTFALPENVDASKIRASYVDGVLKVELPKAPKETPKSWAVEIN
jgi:HSP20 family molecular chaperone IbpA